jgi:hypothetical protein
MDLFEQYENLPEPVKEVLNSYNEDVDAYIECKRLLTEVEKLGYTFDYGLCGTPINLRKHEHCKN